MSAEKVFDALVVGGGPAGLSAALWLARYRRRVLVVDAGEPRNMPTWAVHGFPGLPEIPPLELRRRIRDQALGAGAQLILGRVVRIDGEKDHFTLRLADGSNVGARRVLLAFGLRDRLPEVEGMDQFYGSAVFHCPDCDGPSMTGAHVAVLGATKGAVSVALTLSYFADRVALLTNGEPPDFDATLREKLDRAHIPVHTERIRRLAGVGERLRAIELEDADPIDVEGMFFSLGADPASSLSEQLECDTEGHGLVCIDSSGETSIRGVYAAGDIAFGSPQLAVTAAAEGARAALTIHRSLLPDWMRVD